MTEIFPVRPEEARRALYDRRRYEADYRRSIDDQDGFWRDVARRIDWVTAPAKIRDVSFRREDFRIRWYEDGALNASFNCIDRHLPERENDIAVLWEGDDPKDDRRITYGELYGEVCRMANILKARGVKRGDRVVIYMPMIPEAAYAMLACARIGAVHSVVFGGFSPDSLASRIDDCEPAAIITADEGLRGGKKVHLKKNVDAALAKTDGVRLVLIVRRTGGDIAFKRGRDLWWHEAREDVAPDCPPEIMNAEDPLFILYTSGSTGKPKGVLHTTGGYLVYAAFTHEAIFDYRP
ncbi:MAG: AMP-binding protein, partial [Pseudomonadota bacterium]